MKEFTKNVILMPEEYNGINKQKGIATFYQEESQLKCNIKCFNFKPTDEKFLIGVVVNGQIFKTSVVAKDLSFVTFLVPIKTKQNDKISCLILNVRQKDYDILLWGSTETTSAWKTSAICSLEKDLAKTNKDVEQKFNFNQNYSNQGNAMNDNKEQFEDFNVKDFSFSGFDFVNDKIQLNEFLDNKNNNSFVKDNMINALNNGGFNANNNNENKYQQENFVSNTTLNGVKNQEKMLNNEQIFEKEQREVEDYIDKVVKLTEDEFEYKQDQVSLNEDSFYARVKLQIDNLFKQNEVDEILQDIIPNGKFCKVKMEEGYYVFGVIYDDNLPQYICYGIPALKKGEQQKDVQGFSQWLPLDLNDEEGKGYWISYQDANSGENIKVEIVC